jgi:hypothetical protein
MAIRASSTHIQDGLNAEEYASQWGGDPVYDRPPRQRGDGYLFYNFSSECVPRTREWLDQFAAAIERTMQSIKFQDLADMPEGDLKAYIDSPDFAEREKERLQTNKDYQGLEKLLRHVRSLEPEAA